MRPEPPEAVVAMRLDALVLELDLLGSEPWSYLQALCDQASLDGAALDLTRREFELLQMLAAAEGQVLRREEIYERVWGYAMARGDRSVDVYVRKLRQKLERASPQRRYIHTHFGIGYSFAVEATATAPAAALEDPAPETAPA